MLSVDPVNQTPVALAEDDNGWFVEPEDGWNANQRVYKAIFSTFNQPNIIVQEPTPQIQTDDQAVKETQGTSTCLKQLLF